MADDNNDPPRAVILPTAVHEDGSFTGLVTHDDGTQEVGRFATVEPDTEIRGRYVQVIPREGTPFLDAIYPLESRKGPSKVNSQAYRDGYDRIDWGRRKDDTGEA